MVSASPFLPVLVVRFAFAVGPLIARFTASGRDVDRTVTGGLGRAPGPTPWSGGFRGTICSLPSVRAEDPELSGVLAYPRFQHRGTKLSLGLKTLDRVGARESGPRRPHFNLRRTCAL